MLQSLSISTAMSQVPLQVRVSPSFILRQQPYEAPPIVYDAGLGVLAYKQSLDSAGPPVQFVFPTVVDGYRVKARVVTAPGDGGVVVKRGHIFLPALSMYQECTLELTVTPPPVATAAKAAKIKMKIDIVVRPTGGG
jgi:hypothetical protein